MFNQKNTVTYNTHTDTHTQQVWWIVSGQIFCPWSHFSGVNSPLQADVISFFLLKFCIHYFPSLSLRLFISLWWQPCDLAAGVLGVKTAEHVNESTSKKCQVCYHSEPIIHSASCNVTARNAELRCAVSETTAHPAASCRQQNICFILNFQKEWSRFGFYQTTKKMDSITWTFVLTYFPINFSWAIKQR